jgi:hypothetical protein
LFLLANTAEYYKESGFKNFFSVFPMLLVGLVSLIYGLFRKKLDPAASFNHWIRVSQFLMFSILGVLMLQSKIEFRNISLLLWAAICIMLLFTERKIFHDAFLLFSKNNITIPGYFSNKVIPWSVIENIVVRQDFVTIYYPGNRYMQYEMLAEVTDTDIKTINLFCQQQIEQKQIA